MAESWIKTNKDWSENYKNQILSYMERDVYPAIGKLPVTAICAANLHPLIADIAERGSSAAMLVRQWVSQVFNYAVQQGLCEHDPAAMLKRVVKRPPVRHNPPLPWHEIPVFVKRLDGWNGHLITKLALRLVALTFVRTIEIRRASWDQFDFATATWHIPADNMKMRRAHIVPLSRQVLALLKELHAVTGAGRYLLPNARQPNAAIGPTTLNNALAALGYQRVFSTHGFRSTATTLLGLLGYPENRVDLQLAHIKNDASRAPYDHTKYISSRRMLMQDWADIWDDCVAGKNIVALTEKFGPMSDRRSALLRVVEREE